MTSIWFSDTVSMWRTLWLTEYLQSTVTSRRIGYIREVFYTKLIDLRRSEEEIMADFSQNVRRSIRLSDREGVTYEESTDMDEFVRFFNRFARQKKLTYWLNAETLKKKNKNYRITRAVKDGEVLFSHLYRCDEEKRRAVYIYGCSILKGESRPFSNVVIGSANRGLHYYDMRIFKAANYHFYDLGGYAHGTVDPELININKFKDEFGGTMVCEANYRSVPMQVASTILNFIVVRKQKRPFEKMISCLSRARTR
ncbi:hypothetical protein EGT07_08260 [Herbaspirillum sp. HC18]|nr:hypothetical protein EGT07_08260 [Herbaspirillum sp. HC18]